jgi:leucyl-tRNA synthetase
MDLVKTREPFNHLLTQGMVIKDGAKMSKSKGNVVDPDHIIGRYGADTARLFILFAAPPTKQLEWSDQGVEGSSRFLKRVWRLFDEMVNFLRVMPVDNMDTGEELSIELKELRRQIHLVIKRVTEDFEKRIQFNTAIAAIMEFVNYLYTFREWWNKHIEPPVLGCLLLREAIDTLTLLLSPFAPHIAEEMWQRMGHPEATHRTSWPVHNEEFLKADEIEIVIQVNGKVRQKLSVPAEIDEESLKAQSLEDPRIQEWTNGKEVKKVIVVPKKLVNIVVK